MKEIFIILLILSRFLIFCPEIIFGQDSEVSIKNINIEDGLSQSQVSCVIQDRKGFLWIGTQDGLNKYDGYGFKVYRHNPLDTNSISSNAIQSIIEDKDGAIWIGTRFGLNQFDRKTGVFKSYMNDPTNHLSISGNNINAIHQDTKGNIWIKTTEKLDRFNTNTKQFSHYDYYHDIFNLTPDDNFFSILEDYKGLIWVGTKDGLISIDTLTEQSKRYFWDDFDEHGISNNEIHIIFEDKDKDLFIGTGNGLNIYNRKRKNFNRYFVNLNKEKDSHFNVINDIYQDNQGILWMGTDAGFVYFDKQTGTFSLSKPGYNDVSFLQEKKISKIIQDNSKIYWIGTWESGLYKMDNNKKKFRFYKKLNNQAPSIISGGIASILIDREEIIWVGYWGGGLSLYNRKTDQITNYSASSPDRVIYGNYVHALFEDSNQKIWIGTRNGITIYDQKLKTFHHVCELYPFIHSVLFVNNRVSSFIEDHEKNIWIGTQHGMFKFDYRTITGFTYNLNDKNSLCSNDVRCMLEDRDGFLWIGTSDGLDKFDPSQNKFYHYSKGRLPSKGLSNNAILSLHEDKNGTMWIGTESGLNKFDKKTETFEFYTQKEEGGFVNDYIYSILEDNSNNFWISNNRGLARFNSTTGFITNYDLTDGLQSYEFNLGAYYKSSKGELFFGGVVGLNSFFPDSIYKNEYIPKLSFTSIEKISKKGKTKEYIDDIKKLVLLHTDFIFTIEFSALEFNRPEKNQYAYKMEGLDDEWINIGTKHYVTFSQIPSGTYTLRIRGSNNDLVWNEEGIALEVLVKPPLYYNKIALVFYTLLVFILLFGIIQYRTRNLRSMNLALVEKQDAARERDKKREELEIKNQSITDSLNYAQRIIQAMMPSKKLFSKIFPDSFILYLPKDIVSGDFYWIAEKNSKVFIAAVDCTGHGIPGAFMSIIGFDLLRNIIKVQGIENPAEILNNLSIGVAETFKGAEGLKVSDGMDIAFTVIDRETHIMEFAGAKNPLYLIRNNNIVDYKADRFAVGLMEEDGNQDTFTKQTIQLEKNDVIYIFSDGYADQFGGPKGKKFKHRRLRHLLLTIHKLPLEQQLISLEQSLLTWKGNLEQVDDILLIGIRPYK